MTIFTKDMLDMYLVQRWNERGANADQQKEFGKSIQEIVKVSIERNAQVDAPYLDLWLRSFDEILSWIQSLAIILKESNGRRKLTDFERSAMILSMKLFADGMAIRTLIVAGFDSSARTVLRSAGEYMEIFVAILHDPCLAEIFVKSDTPQSAKSFWENELRPRKMRKRIRAAWREFFKTIENEDTALWFADWGYKSFELLSAMSHPSFGGALLSALPLKSDRSHDDWISIWGDRCDASVTTISIFSSFLFPIILLSNDFPFGGLAGKGRIATYDPENEFHFHVKEGKAVIASMILSMHSPESMEYIFPKPDLSIFPEEIESPQ